MANDVAVLELANPIAFVPGIIEKVKLPGTVLQGGNVLTMKDGIQVSNLNLLLLAIFVWNPQEKKNVDVKISFWKDLRRR